MAMLFSTTFLNHHWTYTTQVDSNDVISINHKLTHTMIMTKISTIEDCFQVVSKYFLTFKIETTKNTT